MRCGRSSAAEGRQQEHAHCRGSQPVPVAAAQRGLELLRFLTGADMHMAPSM